MNDNSLIERTKLVAKVAFAGFTHSVNPQIHQLILHVTKKCNFRCRHCFVDFGDVPKDLTLDEIQTISETLGKLIWLEIGGGEPFLRKDLLDVISLFKFEEVSIPTNGWYKDKIVGTTEKLASRFGNKVTIILSIDGLRETHDEIRKQDGSFDQTMDTFKSLRSIPGIRVAFLSTLCERNADELLELIKFTESLRPDYFAVNILRGNPIDTSYKLDLNDVRRFWEKLEKHYESSGYSNRRGIASVPLNYVRLRWEKAISTIEERRQVIPCLGGSGTIVVHPNGDVGPCEILQPVASIKHQSLPNILQSEEWHRTVKSIKEKKCYCTHECNMKSSIFLKPSFYPSLLFDQL